jgi:ATP-binding cassette subfamily B protein
VFFLSHPIGTLQNTLQKECEKLSDGIAAFITIAAVGVQILMLAAVAWSLSHTMVIICVALVAVFVMITRWLDRSVRHFAALTTATANGITQSIMESLSGAKLILAAGRGRVMLQRYSDAYRKHAGYAVKAQVVANAIPSLYQAFGIFSVSLALYVSLHRGENLSTLIAALWTLLRVVPLFTQLITNVTTTSNVVPSFAQYSGLIREAEAAALPSGGIALASLKQDIEFERVSFGYPGRRTALDQVTLTIPKGSFTAFVGDSGSGKTTTVDILLRLLVPDSGRVSIDGIDLAGYDLGSLLDRVAYVQQDSFLFHASIRENLLWAKPDASTAELWDALRLANIDEFVRSLPSTLDTLVGDRGMALSGGQRQRIALARALVKKPDILILDEATSALDSESERLIMKSIDAVAPYTTIIAVAHRLSTVARADLVYVFSAGTIVEAGPYARLRETPGSRLRELISAQQGGLVA